jgi:hypothetical protein
LSDPTLQTSLTTTADHVERADHGIHHAESS